MTLEQVLKSIDDNKNITREYKSEIKNIISLIVKQYPSVDLASLYLKISSLKCEKGSKYVFNDIIDYNALSNTITINIEQDGYDRKNLLAYALVKMAFSNKDKQNEKYQAIEAGMCSQVANLLVGNDGDKQINQEELIEVNLLSSIIGFDVIESAFLSNNYSALDEAVKKENGLEQINEKMNYNHASKQAESGFVDIEKDLIDVLYSRKRDPEQISFFEENLVLSPNLMDEPDKHMRLDDTSDYYFKRKEEYVTSLKIVEPNPRLGINIGAYTEAPPVQLDKDLEINISARRM